MRHFFVLFCIFLLLQSINAQEESIKYLTLNDAIETGLKNNPSIIAAIENISASKGRYLSGISLPQPEISYDNEWIPSGKSFGSGIEITFSVSQEFEFPSIYFLKGSKFSKAEEKTYLQLTLVERNILKQIKTAYYKVLVMQLNVKTAEENLAISEDFLKKAEIKLNVGESTNLEKLTAKVQYSEAINSLENSKNDLKNAFAELNFALGFNKNNFTSRLILTDSLTFVDYSNDIIQLNKTFESNSQIKIAEINKEIASVEQSIANSSYLPNIKFSYFMQSRENISGYYGGSVGISVPLWFMFEQKGKTQEANSNLNISEFELQQIINETELNLRNAIIDFENDLKQVKLYSANILPQAEEIFITAVKSYDAGELTYLEYLQAKQTLLSSKHNYTNAIFNYYQAVFLVEEIVGKNILSK
jgi:outer membrane protein TolC